ncbi:MAG: ATP-dependent RecD-like DNA helicase, partial [Lachnospiraceae bacterium]|nr:ATP-dependent RecD-like DNA helicase [Lachnospiraceae bacterium]
METIEGYVEHIVYRNEDNGYTVMNMVSEGEEITCVGILPFVSEGELVEAGGRYTEHSTYGEQFQIETYEIKAPEDALAMERYL